MARVNNIFTGKIDGVTPYERYGQIGRLDRNQDALKNRMENINEIIENDDFFMDYFDEYYNPVLNNDSALSEENNICQMLGSMADYLINSDESRKMEEENKTEYVFTDDYFDKKTKRHESFNQESVNDDDNSNKQYIQKPKESTKFKNDKLKINKKDLTNKNEMGSILTQYQSFINRINLIIDQNKSNTRRYNSIKSSILDDMKLVKESYLGVFPHSKNIPHGHYLKPIPSPDYYNIKTFRSMINSSPVGLEENYESWENYYDFSNIIEDMFNSGILDYEEVGIIKLRMHGFEYKEIINILGINCKTKDYEKEINTIRIRKIHNKLNKYLEEKNNAKN